MKRWSYRRLSAAGAIGLALLPILAILGLSARPVMRTMGDGVRHSTQAIAKAVALEVARYLVTARRSLASLDSFIARGAAPSDTDSFIASIIVSRPDIESISVLDAAGIARNSWPSEAAVGKDYSGRPEFRRLSELPPGQVLLSRPFVSPENGAVTVTAWMRFRDSIGSLTLHLDSLADFIEPLRISQRDRIAVVDQSGRYVAHTEMFFVHEQRYASTGAGDGSTLVQDGRRWILFESPVAEHGWRALYYRDYEEAYGLIEGLARWVATAVGLAVALALALAFALRRMVIAPLDALGKRISALSRRDFSRPPSGSYLEEFATIDEAFSTMAATLGERDERISRDLQEKTILLQEIHHRVKNNLQVISSLLNLECAQVRDPQDAELFRSSQERVQSMAIVHELLYETTDFSTVDLAEYAGRLLSYLRDSYPLPQQRLELSLARVEMTLDQALSAGLLLNELITNALKYGHLPGQPATVSVRIGSDAGSEAPTVSISVKDRGPGLPDGVGLAKSGSLGFSLIRSLTAQLDGALEWKDGAAAGGEDGGLEVRVAFPLRRPETAGAGAGLRTGGSPDSSLPARG